MRFLAIFLTLVRPIDFILQILIELNVLQHSAMLPGRKGSFKNHKNAFLNELKSQNEVFGHFHMFGQLDRLDIADCDRTKCSPTLGKVNRSWMIIQKPQKLVYDWSKEPKMRFLVIFINLVWWIDLILQIVIEVNVLKHWARLTDHEGLFKYHKNAFLNDPNSQK